MLLVSRLLWPFLKSNFRSFGNMLIKRGQPQGLDNTNIPFMLFGQWLHCTGMLDYLLVDVVQDIFAGCAAHAEKEALVPSIFLRRGFFWPVSVGALLSKAQQPPIERPQPGPFVCCFAVFSADPASVDCSNVRNQPCHDWMPRWDPFSKSSL